MPVQAQEWPAQTGSQSSVQGPEQPVHSAQQRVQELAQQALQERETALWPALIARREQRVQSLQKPGSAVLPVQQEQAELIQVPERVLQGRPSSPHSQGPPVCLQLALA